MSPDRVDIICIDEDLVIGYCSVQLKGICGILSNLIVDSDYQGLGIGRNLEKIRIKYCRYKRLNVYVSCTTVDKRSQKFKSELSLVPINVKYGYRYNVYERNDLSSAVTYISQGNYRFADCAEEEITLNYELRRIRIVSKRWDYIKSKISSIPECKEFYVDILVTREMAKEMTEISDFKFQGLDFNHFYEGKLHCLLQFKNNIYNRGIEINNKFYVNSDQIFEMAWNLITKKNDKAIVYV